MTNEEMILALLTQMQADIGDIKSDVSDLKSDVSNLKSRVGNIELTLENTVTPALDALAEGQDLLHQKLKELASREDVDDLRAEVRMLRKVVALHTQEIEDLKQAQ